MAETDDIVPLISGTRIHVAKLSIGCCTCGVKTFQSEWHDADCPARSVAEALDNLDSIATALTEQAAQIERLEKALRTVQNAAKTIASSHGTELEHLRQNYAFDHKLRAEVESLREANSLLTDQTDAAEARATTAERERDEARAALRKIANGREVRFADGTTEVVDRDDASEIARAALTKGGENGQS